MKIGLRPDQTTEYRLVKLIQNVFTGPLAGTLYAGTSLTISTKIPL